MAVKFEQGETITWFHEGKQPDGAPATIGDLTGLSASGKIQKARRGSLTKPDNDQPVIPMTALAVAGTADVGAGFRLTIDPATSLALEPGLYIVQAGVTFPDGNGVIEQAAMEIKAAVK